MADLVFGLPMFVVWGVLVAVSTLPTNGAELSSVAGVWAGLFWLVLGLPSLAIALAWRAGFPRWVFAYLGSAVLFALLLTTSSTPGIDVFGYPTFGRELWGWRAWAPLAVGIGGGLAMTRSIRPLSLLVARVQADLSLVSFSLLGCLPLQALAAFDDIAPEVVFPYAVAMGVILVLSAAVYLASTRGWVGLIALAIGATAVVGTAAWVPAVYWHGSAGIDPLGLAAGSLVTIAFILTPAVFGVARSLGAPLADPPTSASGRP